MDSITLHITKADNGFLLHNYEKSVVVPSFDVATLGKAVAGFFKSTLYKIMISGYGDGGNKIALIRALREAYSLSLIESKRLAELCELREDPERPYYRTGYKKDVIVIGTLEHCNKLFEACKRVDCQAILTLEVAE